jgi:prepilin-type N-terminal cleavage/methylation domain-containing protein
MRKNQKGFSVLEVLLAVVLLAVIAGVGFYINRENTIETNKTSTNQSKKATWREFTNSGNEFRLFYPSDWTEKWEGNGVEEALLQSYSFGPTKEKRPIYIFEKIAAEEQPGTTVTHLHSGTTVLSSDDLRIGGILANHEVSEDQYTKWQTYSFWHKKMLLELTMSETNKGNPTLPNEDNTAYVDTFSKIAKSVCMADMYSSGKCATLADYNKVN